MTTLRGISVRLDVRLTSGRIYAIHDEFELKTMLEASLYRRTSVRPLSRPGF